MIERLNVNGYLSLVDVNIKFKPLTVLLGRNGAGKSASSGESVGLIGLWQVAERVK